MSGKYFIFTALFAFLLAGCATYSDWTPVVDPDGDANAENISKDKWECQELAKEASGAIEQEVVKSALIGGAIGAAAGAVIGAAAGAPGQGAAVGAAVLGSGGAVKQGLSAEETYMQTYRNCMMNRGHNVIN